MSVTKLPLGEAVEIIRTGSTPLTSRPEYYNGSVPWFTPGDIGETRNLVKSERCISGEGLRAGKAKLFEKSMLLVTCIGDIGRVGVLQQPSSANQQITALKFKSDIDVHYAYYWFIAHKKNLEQFANQAIVPILNNERLEEVEFCYPVLTEQRRIVDLLTRADRLRRLRRYARQLGDSYLQSVFVEMFGEPKTNLKGWVIHKLGEVGKLDRGRSKNRPRNAPELYGGKYPFIQTGDISNAQGYIRTFQQAYSELGLKQSKLWKAGTLCITIAANIAKTAILTFDSCFPDSVVGFVPIEKVNTEYVQYWFSFVQKELEETAPESAQKNINLEILRELPIPLPPLSEQERFARVVSRYERLRAQQAEAEGQAEMLFQSLLAQAFG